MSMTLHHRRWLAPLAIVALALSLLAAAPSYGASDQVQRSVDAYMASHPGGHQISATDVSYGNGKFIVTVVKLKSQITPAALDCPSGWYCFYDYVNFGYPRGKLSDCGWQDLGTWGWRNRTDSVQYNLSVGSVVFINETGSTDTALFSVSTSKRTIANVDPYRNQADYVYRYC